MNEKPTLKRSSKYYNLEDYNPENPVETSPEFLEDMSEDHQQLLLEDYLALEEHIKPMVQLHVKEYCEEHFEEIIAAAIMLHEAKKKRKQVKAASLTFKTEKSNK